jgi:hypothetical protein
MSMLIGTLNKYLFLLCFRTDAMYYDTVLRIVIGKGVI